MIVVQLYCIFALLFSPFGNTQETYLDNAVTLRMLRAVKDISALIFGRTGDDVEYHREGRHQGRVQRRISEDVPFPCNVTSKSKSVPKSVHALRPGDIDVIGAMGDSITAGSGVFAKNIFHVLVENRGVTALGGGQGTWRDYLTIPNIIKEFNPNLIGYSPYDASTHQKASVFNVAEVAAMSRDLPYMAEILSLRIKNHPNVDVNKNWKLISVLIGANDFCSDMCWLSTDAWSVVQSHKIDLIKTLRILKRNLPRTLISIVPPPNLELLTGLRGKSLLCTIANDFECTCLVGQRWILQREKFSAIMRAWQRLEEEIASRAEFQTEEFAVVVQPFLTNLTFPTKPGGNADFRYLSSDCFHLSQIANARATIAIWKNMLEPVGEKSRDWNDERLACPTEQQPYITTLLNSRKTLTERNDSTTSNEQYYDDNGDFWRAISSSNDVLN